MRPTAGWKRVARADGSSSCSDPVEALWPMAWGAAMVRFVAHVRGPGCVDEAVAYTGHETTSLCTRLGITSRLAGRMADHPLSPL